MLAEHENAADLKGGIALGELRPDVRSVVLDVAQSANIGQSVEAADRVLGALDRVGAVRKREVQQAAFVVLKSPDIPSMLVETAYISNRAAKSASCARRPSSSAWPRRSSAASTAISASSRPTAASTPALTAMARATPSSRAAATSRAIRSPTRFRRMRPGSAAVCTLRAVTPRGCPPGLQRMPIRVLSSQPDRPDRGRRGHRATRLGGQGADRERLRRRRAAHRDRHRARRTGADPRARRRLRPRRGRPAARGRAPRDQQDCHAG